MPYNLSNVAITFLTTSDISYVECERGIATLDRLIVATPSSIANQARGYLVPILYAYWERFFRVCFGEYVKCLTAIGIKYEDAEHDLLRNNVRKHILHFLKTHRVKAIHELVDRHPPSNLKAAVQNLSDFVSSPVTFSTSLEWVETESNVKFSVLENNCKRFCVDLDSIKNHFSNGTCLKDLLKDLVDIRNDIAHGGQFSPFSQTQWEEKKNFTIKIMQALQMELYVSLETGSAIVNQQATDDFQI